MLFALLVAVAGPAEATTFDEKRVDCPVCAKPFPALKLKSSNTYGGYDSDLCVHANGEPPNPFLVWTCPSCRFSARAEQFGKGVPEETKKKILAGWPDAPPGFPAKGDQRSIPTWQKWELAGRILDETKASGAARKNLWRDAAFAERCTSSDGLSVVRKDKSLRPGLDDAMERVFDRAIECPPTGPELLTRSARFIRAAQEILAEAAKAPAAERPFLDLAAGAVLRRRGEFVAAAVPLKRVAEAKDAPAPLREAARALLESIEREKRFLERAVALVRLPKDELLKLVLDKEDRARGGWTLAESFRRLGEDDQAAAWARAALVSKEAGDWMFLLAGEVLARKDAGGPLWTAAVNEGLASWKKGLLARLRDESTAEAAAAVLGLLEDPALLPDLLAAFAGADATAAQHAATAIGGYSEPGAAAVEALAKFVADENSDLVVRWSATEALCVLAPESAGPALLVAARSDGVVREAACRALGRAGEADAVPALLAAAKEDPGAALPALSLLALRELASLDAAEAWWKENRSRKRADWTRDAFRAAGADLPAPPDRAAVPRLVELLENESLPVRWAAFRALRSISGRSFGREEILDEGRINSLTAPVVPFTVEEVLGDGRSVSYGAVPGAEMGAMLEKMTPHVKVDNARVSWRRAQAQWRRWWREQGEK